MQIKKHYKFYAGHRNQELNDRCSRPHGHFYQIYVTFNVIRHGAISTLFNDFDSVIEPWLKNNIDHRFFMDNEDILLKYFQLYEQDTKQDLGYIILPFPSSVENVSFYLFDTFKEFGFNVERIELQETISSTIIYDKDDYKQDYESYLGDLLEKFKNK